MDTSRTSRDVRVPTPIVNPLTRYAIYFNEGPGYLLVDHLSDSGSFSVTMLVQSLQDQRIYVRKLHHVQPFKSQLNIQCDDERNAVYESHVPALITSANHHRTIVEQRLNETRTHRFVTPATIWEFCNGGELNTLFNLWDQGETSKVPEALVWNFFASLLQTLIHFHDRGLNHGDAHARNLFLHWPDGAILPEIYLADFGFAQDYPGARNTPFAIPWTGAFDNGGKPLSSNVTAGEKAGIRAWYAQCQQDVRNILLMLHTLVCTGRLQRFIQDDYQDIDVAISNAFIDAARRGARINGYSSELIKVMATVSHILTKLWNDPIKYMANLKQLHIEVTLQARPVINEFNRDPQNRALTDWMRPAVPHRSQPLAWDNSDQVISPDAVSENLPSVNRNDLMAAHLQEGISNVFRVYEQGPWKAQHPLYSISHPQLSTAIELRADEFQIVRLQQDAFTGEFDLDSISFIDPPSTPNSSDAVSTYRLEQRGLPERPVPTTAPITRNQHRPNFIQNWVNARLSPAAAPRAILPTQRPSSPDDSDEDTSRGRRWRAWRQAMLRGTRI